MQSYLRGQKQMLASVVRQSAGFAAPLLSLKLSSCREGRSQPSGKRGDDKRKKQNIASESGSTKDSAPNALSNASSEKQRSNLERLHNQTDVRNSIKMQQDRLKLDPAGRSSQKRKAKSTFEMQFTEIKVQPKIPCNIMVELLDEDLPTVEELLSSNTGRKSTGHAILQAAPRPSKLASEDFLFSSPVAEESRKRLRTHSPDKTVSDHTLLVKLANE
jgi:hypothetical protein